MYRNDIPGVGGRGGDSRGRRRRRRRNRYGPRPVNVGLGGRGSVGRRRRDRRVRRGLSASETAREELLDNDRLREEESSRITEEDAMRVSTLTVSNLDLHVDHNTAEHNTNDYHCTLTGAQQLVVRRGQEFALTLTFDRPYQKKDDDLFFIFTADDDPDSDDDDDEDRRPSHKKVLRVNFQLDEHRTEPFEADHKGWGARIHPQHAGWDTRVLSVLVFVPGNCVVGEWDVSIRTRLHRDGSEDFEYEHPLSVIVLFNPWSAGDEVCFTEDRSQLEEYVLNDKGSVFRGTAAWHSASPWIYGQFQPDILHISLSLLRMAFNFTMTPSMARPVEVSRALSRIVNSQNDDGVLIGNWSGEYTGGTSPTYWESSTAILRQFYNSKAPVMYGQCWVFSHVLTTVCRAVGLPCRSVTNFESAHDTNKSCTIDKTFDEDGTPLPSKDSIWNFHVWNEVWMLRPDLGGHYYDGWHVIDATPQEPSMGLMQCGPCPVQAVKRGEITVGYDTPFVFSEVNALVVSWVQRPDGRYDVSEIDERRVGKKVVTNWSDDDTPQDITSIYKHPEGSQNEKDAMEKALRRTYEPRTLNKDMNVKFDADTGTEVGKDLELKVVVTNASREDKDVEVTIQARATRYWDDARDTKKLAQENFKKSIRAGRMTVFGLKVGFQQYMGVCDEQWNIVGSAVARDVWSNKPYTAEQRFHLTTPPLSVKGPPSAASGQSVTVTISFSNPLPLPLTRCQIHMDGTLELAADDTHAWSNQNGTLILDYRRDSKVRASERVVVTIRLMGKWEAGERRRTKTMAISFDCRELGVMQGHYKLKRRE